MNKRVKQCGTCSKRFHHLNDTQTFDVSSKGRSSENTFHMFTSSHNDFFLVCLDAQLRNNFFVRSNNANAVYLECPQTGRHSVLVPYSGPQG